MKKLLILIPALLIALIAGAVWWKYGRARDPYTIAQQLLQKGDARGAQIELRNAIKLNAQNAPAHFRLGQLDLRLGEPVAAEKELRTARDLGFDQRAITLPLAQSYMAQSRHRDLLRDFPVQGLPPDQAAEMQVMRATAYLAVNEPDNARNAAAEAERLAPQSIDALLISARVALATNNAALAQQKIERALQINPRSTDALQSRAQLENLRGDRTRALDDFDAAIALNPNLLQARLERANILLFIGQDKRAREDVDIVLKAEPRSAMGVYLLGVLQARAQDYAGADASFTRLGGMVTRFPRAFYFIAVTKYNLGQAEQAADAAARFIARNPDDPDAIKLYSRIELALRRPDRVIEVLTRAVDKSVPDAETLDLLGRAYSLAGRPQLALQSLERAAALAPRDPDLLARLAVVRLSAGDSAGATSDLEHVLNLAPNQPGAGETLVLAAIASGAVDKAAVALERLRRQQGDSETVGNLSALIKMAQLDISGAEATLVETIKQYPNAIQARINLAKVRVLQDRSADAQKVLGEVLDRQPTNPVALSNLVTLLLGDGKLPQAVTRLEAAHAAAPKDVDVTIGLANLYLRTANPDKGLALVDDVLKDQPDNTALLSSKAKVLVALGRVDDARSTYRSILALTPTDIDARRSLADLQVGAQELDAAKQTISEGLKLQPGNPALLQAYVTAVLKSAGLEAALAAADQLEREPANMPAARSLRGDVYMGAGRYNDAIAAYTSEMRVAPSTPLLLRLVAAYNAAARPDQSSQVLRDWLAAHPDDVSAAETLAGLDIAARRFFDAESRLLIVLNRRPDDAGALNNLAWVYQQREDPRALATAQKAYLVSPGPESADTLGWILTTSGKADTGVTLLRQAAGELRNDPTIHYHLAVALKDVGQRAEAIAALQPAIMGLRDFDDRPAALKLYQELQAAK